MCVCIFNGTAYLHKGSWLIWQIIYKCELKINYFEKTDHWTIAYRIRCRWPFSVTTINLGNFIGLKRPLSMLFTRSCNPIITCGLIIFAFFLYVDQFIWAWTKSFIINDDCHCSRRVIWKLSPPTAINLATQTTIPLLLQFTNFRNYTSVTLNFIRIS